MTTTEPKRTQATAWSHCAAPAAANRWLVAAPLPRGANHVGVAMLDGKLYAIGGFVEQNRKPHAECFVYTEDGDRWEQYTPMPTPRHGLGAAAIGRAIHVAGGGAVMGGGMQTSIHEAFTLD